MVGRLDEVDLFTKNSDLKYFFWRGEVGWGGVWGGWSK